MIAPQILRLINRIGEAKKLRIHSLSGFLFSKTLSFIYAFVWICAIIKIQELFSYYLAASELVAFAYALLGEQRTYQDIFTPDSELLDDRRLANLKNCEAYLGISDERWYSAPERYLECIERKAQEVFLPSQDAIKIEVTGSQILEAI